MVKSVILVKGKNKENNNNNKKTAKKERKFPVLSLHTSSFIGSFGGLNSSW
jgi:hypothetical protein